MNTNWLEQGQDMMKAWTQAQAKLWENWTQLGTKQEVTENPVQGWMSQWQEMAKKNLGAFTAGASGVPKEVVDRVFSGEGVFLRFVEFWTNGLKALSPNIQAGENWAELLRRYLAQVKRELESGESAWMTPAGLAATTKDLPELWSLYRRELEKMTMPWFESLRDAQGHVGQAMSGDRQATVKMFNLFVDTFESTLGKFSAAPAIGYTREFQEKQTRAFETWVEVRKAEAAFQTEIANTGLRSLENLVERLVKMGETGEKIKTLRQLFDLWVETAETVYFEVASTESFAEIQGRLVNAAMHYRVHERELGEVYLKALHIPTRGELDDAYRHMADLRREVKALRREMTQLQEEREKSGPVAPLEPSRRRSRAGVKATAAFAEAAPAGGQVTDQAKEG
ncbi:MAG: class III poly(R)-hydroxyalkanoic acid synthase subunit PhaE [Deltaproteobacteria bacterium]|nr:class III poly(R)-hydroxyalkanoic acid synthase subunit PhaE [Deltaproteobacteria bacterium]